jgi:hypothetical protein
MGDDETMTWYDHEGNLMSAPASDEPTGWGRFDRLTHRIRKSPPGQIVQAITKCGHRAHEVPGRGEVNCPECLAIMRGEDPHDRFHLTLDAGEWPAMQGWWADRTTAEAKFKAWVGKHGRDGVRITLVDEDTGTTLAEWPGDVSGQP